MSLFHRHSWKEVGRRFVPPVKRSFNLKGWDWNARALADQYMRGATVVELRCEECGDVGYRTLPGDALAVDREEDC